jgi:hypothetical protein
MHVYGMGSQRRKAAFLGSTIVPLKPSIAGFFVSQHFLNIDVLFWLSATTLLHSLYSMSINSLSLYSSIIAG